MTLWMVRAGKHGQQEQTTLDQNVITIGWNDLPDLNDFETKDELEAAYMELYPDASKGKIGNEVGQIWRFYCEIQKGDLVGLPLKTQSTIAIGEVKSQYRYEKLAENVVHIHDVEWIKQIPRSTFNQDLLYSFGAFMTVCQISRNDAEERVKHILETGKDKVSAESDALTYEEENIDIETYSRDQIIKYIDRKFKGHDLARLVNAVLLAQGYKTHVSSPGRDGGVDILAASGPLGFSSPRICVQVKSTSTPIDVTTVRGLQGVMAKMNADHGLFVSLGGYTKDALKEAKEDFFKVRIWDEGTLLNAIFENYQKFDDDLKAELPLKRIWGLVQEEED